MPSSLLGLSRGPWEGTRQGQQRLRSHRAGRSLFLSRPAARLPQPPPSTSTLCHPLSTKAVIC